MSVIKSHEKAPRQAMITWVYLADPDLTSSFIHTAACGMDCVKRKARSARRPEEEAAPESCLKTIISLYLI